MPQGRPDQFAPARKITGVHAESYSEGFKAQFQEGINNNLATKIYHYGTERYTEKHTKDIPYLSEEQAKDSPYYRPSINISGGISEYRLKRQAEQYDAQQERLHWINETPSGSSGFISNMSAAMIAGALDPITVSTSIYAPELIGIRAAPLIARMTNPLARRLVSAGAVGTTEGLVAGMPLSIATLFGNTSFQSNPNWADDMIATTMMNVGLGGLIRGITGVKVPISKQAYDLAKQTSAHQIAEGYFPFVDDVLQQGYVEARQEPARLHEPSTGKFMIDSLRENGLTYKNAKPLIDDEEPFFNPKAKELLHDFNFSDLEELELFDSFKELNLEPDSFFDNVAMKFETPEIRKFIREGLENQIGRIKEVHGKLSETFRKLPNFSQQTKFKNISHILKDNLDALNSESLNDTMKSTRDMMNLKLPSYMREALDTLRKSPEYRSKQEVEKLSKIIFQDEEKTARDSLNELNEKMKTSDSDLLDLLHDKERKNLQRRLRAIKKSKEKLGESFHPRQLMSSLELKQNDINYALNQDDLYNLMLKDSGTPVTQDDLRAAYFKSQEPDAKLFINSESAKALDNILNTIPETLEESYAETEEVFKNLDTQDGALAREEIERINNIQGATNKALDNAAKCLGA